MTDSVHSQMRKAACQALFVECLRRYKEVGERASPPFGADTVIKLSLATLKKNGFTREEIERAMA